MDFKTTPLNKLIEVQETPFQELEDLKFGIVNDHAVFDMTAYNEANGIENLDHKIFMRLCKHLILNLIKGTAKKETDLFYQNKNGNILISAELAFLYLSLANPDMSQYFNALLSDLFYNGIAVSHGYLSYLAGEKLPTDVLKDLIKERMNDTGNQ